MALFDFGPVAIIAWWLIGLALFAGACGIGALLADRRWRRARTKCQVLEFRPRSSVQQRATRNRRGF